MINYYSEISEKKIERIHILLHNFRVANTIEIVVLKITYLISFLTISIIVYFNVYQGKLSFNVMYIFVSLGIMHIFLIDTLKYIQISKYKELKKNDLLEIRQAIEILNSKFEKFKPVAVLYKQSSTYSASTIRLRNYPFLIISRNMVSLFYKNRNLFNAIISHELSHLNTFEDTDWWIHFKYFEILLLGTIGLILLNNSSFLLILIFSIGLLLISRKLSKANILNEFIADLGSIYILKRATILEWLSTDHMSANNPNTHLNSKTRVRLVENFLKDERFDIFKHYNPRLIKLLLYIMPRDNKRL